MKAREIILAIFAVSSIIFFGYWAFVGTSGGISVISNNLPSASNSSGSSNYNPNTYSGSFNLTQSSQAATSSFNLTNVIAQNLSASFVSEISNNASTTTTNNVIAGAQLDNLASTTLDFNKPIDVSKLSVISDNSQSAKENYFKQVIFATDIRQIPFDESTAQQAVADLMQKNDPTQANDFKTKIDAAVATLVKIPTPPDYLYMHEQLITSLENISYFYGLLLNYQNDPFKLMGVKDYFPLIVNQADIASAAFKKEFDALAQQ